jgi:fibro-slime domain-containing protein
MVQDTLSSDRKPIFKANLCYNSRLNEWFRPSGSDTSVHFVYDATREQWLWTGLVRSSIDPTGWQGPLWKDRPADPMANIVFYDSLPFLLSDSTTGTYQFIRDNNLLNHEQFFWLDGKGFGNETSQFNHNYSYAMELHDEGVYNGGEYFEFQGDDDAWLFINGKLVVDLGGTQNEGTAAIYLDQLARTLGLAKGEPYTFDFFYTERLAFQSNCVITTNMLTPLKEPVDSLLLSVQSDTIIAGQTDTLQAFLINRENAVINTDSSIYNLVNWQILNGAGYARMPGDTIYFPMPKINNQKIITTATAAYRSYQIRAYFIDPRTSQLVDDTATIYVTAGPAYRLVVEDTRTPDLRIPAPRQLVLISSSGNIDSLSFAYLRDRYNNLVDAYGPSRGGATMAQWRINPLADTSFARVAPASDAQWHGLVTRVQHLYGNTHMIVSQQGVAIPDTVPITISNVLLTRIRVVDTTGAVVTSITITTDQHEYLRVQGLPSNAPNDSARYWVDANGRFTLNNLVSDPAPSTNFVLSYVLNPAQPGTGTIVVYSSEPGVSAYTIQVTVTAAPRIFSVAPAIDTVAADTSITIVAVVRDGAGASRPELAALVTWSLINADALQAGDQLLTKLGERTILSATKAYRWVLVEGVYIDPETGVILRDTSAVFVSAGIPYRVVIENTSTPDLNRANRRISVFLPGTRDADSGSYAYIRDKFDNLIAADNGRATQARWRIDPAADTAFAQIAGIPGKLWQGIVTRQNDSSGTTKGIAWQLWNGVPLMPDTVLINMSKVSIVAIRIIDATADTVVSAITMTTDNSISLVVEGLPSNAPNDSAHYWLRGVSGTFALPTAIQTNPSLLTTAVTQWVFSPVTAGNGNLIVSYQYNSSVKDTIPVVVIAAAPSRVTIELLPEEDGRRMAGIPFHAVVKIYNGDGLVSGTWCYPGQNATTAVYQDIIMRIDQTTPVVVTDNGSGSVNLRLADGQTISNQCFVGGIDTIAVTLYYAPVSADSLHQLFVRLGGSIRGSPGIIEGFTLKFRLLPGPVDSIVLAHPNGTPLPASMILAAPTGFVSGIVKGYDAYGNVLPNNILSDWSKTGEIAAPQQSLSTVLYYTTKDVVYGQEGCITAVAHDNPAAIDSVCLIITAPAATFTAITRDTSGNGYLDRVELHFNKLVTLADADTADIRITYQYPELTVFSISDIVPAQGDTAHADSVYYLILHESTTDLPQTAWIPSIAISGVSGVADFSEDVIDGAGPVIWSVVENIEGSEAEVTVTFSEIVEHADGSTLNQTIDKPELMFNVWHFDGTDTTLDTEFLSAAASFTYSGTTVGGDMSVVKFVIDCANDTSCRFLSPKDYLNIRVISSPGDTALQIVDNNGSLGLTPNEPVADNIKRQSLVINKVVRMTSGPNPFPPTAYWNESKLILHDINTLGYLISVRQVGGTILKFEVSPPTNSIWGPVTVTELKAELAVHDMAGNLVYHRFNNELLRDSPEWRDQYAGRSWDGGESRNLYFVWGGMNDRSMRCAPGVYRAALKLSIILSTQNSGRQTYTVPQATIAMGVRR